MVWGLWLRAAALPICPLARGVGLVWGPVSQWSRALNKFAVSLHKTSPASHPGSGKRSPDRQTFIFAERDDDSGPYTGRVP